MSFAQVCICQRYTTSGWWEIQLEPETTQAVSSWVKNKVCTQTNVPFMSYRSVPWAHQVLQLQIHKLCKHENRHYSSVNLCLSLTHITLGPCNLYCKGYFHSHRIVGCQETQKPVWADVTMVVAFLSLQSTWCLYPNGGKSPYRREPCVKQKNLGVHSTYSHVSNSLRHDQRRLELFL